MGYKESDRAGARHPMLEVKRVTLEDGLHASLILENGRICKLVSPSGEVAVLKWEGDQSSPRHLSGSTSQADPLRSPPRGRGTTGRPEGFDAARHFWASKSAKSAQQPSGLNDTRSRRSSAELSVSAGRAPPSTPESSEGAEVPGPAEIPAAPAAVPEDAGEGLEIRTENTGNHGIAGLETGADAQGGATQAADETLGDPGSEGASQQQGAQETPSGARDTGAVNFWPDAVDAAQAGMNGTIEQDADERWNLLLATNEPDAGVTPAVQPGEGCSDGHLAQCASAQASPHSPTGEHVGREPEQASQHSSTGKHVSGEPGEADVTGQRTHGEPEEASQHGSEEDDKLEELMGAVPMINLRELKTQVASLPEILSRAERTAEQCARGSAPGCPKLPTMNPQKLSDSSIHSWVAQSRATAIVIEREHHIHGPKHRACTGNSEPGQPHGRLLHRDAPGSQAESSTAGSPGRTQAEAPKRLSARRSLADVRAAIGIASCPGAAATGALSQPAKEEQEIPENISALQPDTNAQAMTQATASAVTSVWGRLFPGRRVRPDSANSRASGAMTAGRANPSSARAQGRSMTERLFGYQRRPQGITLADWPAKPCAQAMEAAQPTTEPDYGKTLEHAAAEAMEEPCTSAATSALTQQTGSRQGTRKLRRHPSKATATRTGMAGRWRMEESEEALAGAQQVEDLLDLPLLQRLAQQRAQEIRILESDDTLELIQIIPLNGKARIVRRTVYPKSGKMVESARADSREGKLRSQLNISPEGHCHMRSLQGEPYAAVFHRRIKMSSGGHRLKIEQKFQLLAPGVMPVKYHSIWHRIEDSEADDMAALSPERGPLLEM